MLMQALSMSNDCITGTTDQLDNDICNVVAMSGMSPPWRAVRGVFV